MFKVSIENGQVIVCCDDNLPETDIINLLQFDENQLADLYLTHAATQARWEQIAINLKNDYERFTQNFEKKWWAYNKKFAKLVLLGYGENKSTVDSIVDTTILIYSQDATDVERDKYLNIAYTAATKKGGDFSGSGLDEFRNEMYLYINMNPAWHFETLVETVKLMEKNYLTVQNIAKRLDSRSFHMKEIKDLLGLGKKSL